MKNFTPTSGSSWPLFSAPVDEFRETVKSLWRRKLLIISITVLGAIVSVVWVLQITPKYTSSAQILIDARGPRAFETNTPVIPGMVIDRETIDSEIRILESRRMVSKLVDKLQLIEDPEFNPTLPEEKSEFAMWVAGIVTPVRDWVRGLLKNEDDGAANGLNPTTVVRLRTMDEVAAALAVVREGQSRVVSVSVTSRDPVRAAELANETAELYLLDHLENRIAQRHRVTDWLEGRLANLRDAASSAERAVEQYRQETGLYELKTDRGTTERVDTQNLAQLSAELIRAQAERIAVESKLGRARGRGGARNYESLPEVLDSPVIGALRSQEVRVKQRIADLELELGRRHPIMVSALGELASIEANIRNEIDKIVEGLRKQVSRARDREEAIRASLRQLEQKTAEQNSAQVRMNELVREAEANQRILEQFLEEAKSLSAKQALDQPYARIIAYAEPPVRPSFPKKKFLVALGTLGSFLLACGLLIVLERFYSRFRTSEDVERVLKLPTLSTVPSVHARGFGGVTAKAASKPGPLLEDPPMDFLNAINSLHVAILSRGTSEITGTTLFTSSFSGEGKSLLAAAFARRLADHNKRVVLVDCDVRHPSVARMLGISPGPGLSEVLMGEITAEEVIQHDPGSPLDVIAAGKAKSTADTLSQDRLQPLLNELSASYDAVVLDTGPVLFAPDSVLLSHHANRTVLVVRWDSTNQRDALRCTKALTDARANLIGVVLNQVDVATYASYAYDDSKNYMRGYKKYYAN